MSDLNQIQIIPLDAAVYCENCRSVNNSPGHRCVVCDSPSLVPVQSMMEQAFVMPVPFQGSSEAIDK